MQIEQARAGDHLTLIAIWEASVRATHHFLPEAEITALRPLILAHYFAAVDLICARDDTAGIVGFCGVRDGNIEMLFVAPEARAVVSAACWWPMPLPVKERPGWMSTSRMCRRSVFINRWGLS